MTREPAYDEPYGWWGPGWRLPARRPLGDLVAEGVLSLAVAGFLAAAIRRRWSLAVVAGPSGAGKTTLLTALLPWLAPGTRRFFLRGSFEPFAFLGDDAVAPQTSTVLCNEISPHLPAYLWGDGVGRLLAARERGFQVLTTAHADDALGFVRLLAGPPLRIAADRVAGFDLVVALGRPGSGNAAASSVAGMWALRPGRGGAVEIIPLAVAAEPREFVTAVSPIVQRGVGRLAADDIADAMGEILSDGAKRAAMAAVPEANAVATPRPWRPRRSRPNG